MHLNFSTSIALVIFVAALSAPVLADEAAQTPPAQTFAQLPNQTDAPRVKEAAQSDIKGTTATETKDPKATETKDSTATETKDSTATEIKDTTAAHTKATPPQRSQASTQPPQSSGPPELHRAKMRLSGSMCMACLHTLEGKLKQLPGVDDVRIHRTQANYFQPVPPELSTWADAIFIYDGKRLSLNDLRFSIKQHGYYSYQVTDQHLDHAPQEKDTKP